MYVYQLINICFWIYTKFKAPLGRDPVSVDLEGFGKGQAWVNRKSLSRYWPSNTALDSNCLDKACDCRGKYDNTKIMLRRRPRDLWFVSEGILPREKLMMPWTL